MNDLNWFGVDHVSVEGYVYVVEDDVGMRDSIKRILISQNYRVLAFSDPLKFLDVVSDKVSPCLLLLDMRLPHVTGLHVQTTLRERGIEMPIVFMSGESTVLQAVNAMKAGAEQFLVKPVSRQDLIDAVKLGLQADVDRRKQMENQQRMNKLLSRLTARESEVLAFVKRGFSNGDIAQELGITVATVKQHKSNVMIKLDVQTFAELLERLQ